MTSFFTAIFYQPLYNGLIFLFDIFPSADAGVIVILFTVIVKLVLFPLSQKSVRTQHKMKAYEPDLQAVREKYKDDKQQQALKIMEFYKEKGINPFASFFLILIQLPIIFSLYYIFLKSGLPEIDQGLLYSFTAVPEAISMKFLGLVDISGKSVILALLAAASGFLQIRYSVPPPPPKKEGNQSFKDDLARMMNFQMRYFFPIVVFFISYSISGVVALYWTTSNLFTVGQEIYVKRNLTPEITKTENTK